MKGFGRMHLSQERENWQALTWKGTSGLHEMREILWLTEQLLASQESICSLQLDLDLGINSFTAGHNPQGNKIFSLAFY
jgi:hypothetical protein